jgi:DHA1 family bicyclomycin/chloramphenicol resistance-like MFS transporter
VLLCQFLTMGAHGISNPCAQAGAVAPFPREAGAAAGLFGFVTMFGALLTGTWVGMSHDGSLQPLAYTSAIISLLLFAAAWRLRHRRELSCAS